VIGASGSMQLNAMGIHCYHPHDAGKAAEYLHERAAQLKEMYAIEHEIRWCGDLECEPRRGYPGDAGFDLVVERDVTVKVDTFVDVPCGVSVEMPPGTWGLITGRSSTLRRRGLLVTQGIIDNGYRGELFAGVQHLNQGPPVELRRGERIAQFIPFRLEAPGLRLRRVAELAESDRGVSGFGSTGA
jgi:dUTP pyrophosphatase